MNYSNSWNPTPSNPLDKLSRDELLMQWDKLKQNLAKAKDAEMEMRKYIVAKAFTKEEGTQTVDLGGGYELKAGIKYNYKLDSDNAKIEAALEKLAKKDNAGAVIADRLINWKASLNLTEYRQLEPKYKAIIEPIITIEDAAPTLEIKAPKAKA